MEKIPTQIGRMLVAGNGIWKMTLLEVAVTALQALAGLATLLALLVFGRFVRWYLSPLRKLPGPAGRSGILGNFLEIRKQPFLEPHKRWWNEAGGADNVPALHYTLAFYRPGVLLLDKDWIRTVLTAPYGGSNKQAATPPAFGKAVRLLSDVLGDGLVTLQGPDWKRHRRMLQPAFNTQFLRSSLNQALPAKVTRFVACWERAAQREMDVSSHLSALTLDVIGDVAFSHDFQALNSVEEWSQRDTTEDAKAGKGLASIQDPLVVYLIKSLRFNLLSVFLSTVGLGHLNRYVNPDLRQNRYMLDQAVDRVVSNAKTENTKARSLLHLMLQAQDPEEGESNGGAGASKLSDAELRDEVKTFLIAGHETTSTWLYWALYALSLYPDIQTRVYQDVAKVAPQGEILVEHVEQMDYLNAFLQETLRMYPPVGLFTRENRSPQRFVAKRQDGKEEAIVIPAGTRLAISPHLLHRHPQYWDRPNDFWPERWLQKAALSAEEEERRRFAFLPFSAGGRNCIGQKFATMEAQLILAPLVRAFRIALAPSQRDTEFAFTTSITMKSKPLVRIVVKKR